ncbi:MAG TPA: hypothetical protein VG389_18430 [Myxococcota bacterium]|jgi:hypothetical protein|nr:hypothetical protein [Myxococcota bacterium]
MHPLFRAIVVLGAAVGAPGCSCSGHTPVGDSGGAPGTDAIALLDAAMPTDAGASGTDAVPGTDALPGTDAAPGNDAGDAMVLIL